MKIFKQDRKINFVDDNNVFLGYSYDKLCCEQFGYFFSREEANETTASPEIIENNNEFDLRDYQFDIKYYNIHSVYKGGKDENRATFLLVRGEEKIYLTLFNYHNGYYSHGLALRDEAGTELYRDYL